LQERLSHVAVRYYTASCPGAASKPANGFPNISGPGRLAGHGDGQFPSVVAGRRRVGAQRQWKPDTALDMHSRGFASMSRWRARSSTWRNGWALKAGAALNHLSIYQSNKSKVVGM